MESLAWGGRRRRVGANGAPVTRVAVRPYPSGSRRTTCTDDNVPPAHHVVNGSAGTIRIDRHQEHVEQFIPLSLVRLISCIGGFALLLSDIPRTGFGTINFAQLYNSVAPDTQITYGPYNYPVTRLRRVAVTANSSSTSASINQAAATAPVPLWPYKYDTLSIPTRGLANYLNVSAYPRCVLYEGECDTDVLDHGRALEMLDALMTATARTLFAGSSLAPFMFLTKSNWVDRLYHAILQRVGMVFHEVRLNSVYWYPPTGSANDPMDVCMTRKGRQNVIAPFFCALMVPWLIHHPVSTHKPALIPLWDHMEARVAQLREEFPQLQFDMIVVGAQYTYTSKRSTMPIGLNGATFHAPVQEISTLIRGQHCVQGDCVTEIIDDYRYERMYIEQNPKEVLVMTASLRGFAQVYIWLRVLCLWWGCYVARVAEPTYSNASTGAKAAAAWRLFFRIPVHVVVYGSWLPVLAYAIAHYIDCNLFHMWFFALWSTINGEWKFDFSAYVSAGATQMRNAWIMGVAVSLLVFIQRSVLGVRGGAASYSSGIVGIRGFAIGISSSLTIFAQVRQLSFRNTDIAELTVLHTSPFLRRRHATVYDTPTEFGFRYEVKILCIAFACVTVVASLARIAMVTSKIANKAAPEVGILWARSHYVPFSVGSIAKPTMLGVFWKVGHLRDRSIAVDPTGIRAQAHDAMATGNVMQQRSAPVRVGFAPRNVLTNHQHHGSASARRCRDCQHTVDTNWQASQGCVAHEHIFDVCRRTPRVWCIVRLTNIVLMTDPLTLWMAYGIGCHLYVHQFSSLPRSPSFEDTASPRQITLLSPVSTDTYRAHTHDARTVPTCIDVINSRTVLWRVLIECG